MKWLANINGRSGHLTGTIYILHLHASLNVKYAHLTVGQNNFKESTSFHYQHVEGVYKPVSQVYSLRSSSKRFTNNDGHNVKDKKVLWQNSLSGTFRENHKNYCRRVFHFVTRITIYVLFLCVQKAYPKS